jgi:hypothetical protein
MSMKDTYNHTGVRLGAYKAFAAADSTTAYTGSAIDTSGFNSVMFSVSANYSAVDAATYDLSITHSDDGSTYTAATGDFIVGPSAALSGSANVQKIGYIGGRKYVKLVVTPSAAATSTNVITVVGHAILSNPALMPVA